MIVAANVLPPQESALNNGQLSLPTSRELGSLFQEEFVGATGLAARWAAEKVQGNRRLQQVWTVPFAAENGVQGCFMVNWDAELQRYLAGRLGNSAGRPEYLGAILRASAGRWASWQALRAGTQVRLQPSPDAGSSSPLDSSPWRSTAALIIDSFVIELAFVLGPREA
jgi:hypothetical protein